MSDEHPAVKAMRSIGDIYIQWNAKQVSARKAITEIDKILIALQRWEWEDSHK